MKKPFISHCKYIHILYHYDTFYNESLVRAFNDRKYFCPEEHLFVTPHKTTYEAIKKYDNTAFFDTGKEYWKAKKAYIINYCAEKCDWLILHSSCKGTEVPLIKKKYLPKIIWRTWGHDQWGPSTHISTLKDLIKETVIRPLWKKRICEMKAIGIANSVDTISLRSILGSQCPPCFILNYFKQADPEKLDCLKGTHKASDTINVMIEHRIVPWRSHLENLKRLEHFSKENIEVYVMLTFSDPNFEDYINEMRDYVSSKWNNNVHFVFDFVPYEQYAEFINQMDIIILDGKGSYALGNVELAIAFREKMFLNRDGLIKQAFDYEKVPCCCTDEIEGMTFEEFSKPIEYPENLHTSLEIRGVAEKVEDWHKMMDWLDSTKEKKDGSK